MYMYIYIKCKGKQVLNMYTYAKIFFAMSHFLQNLLFFWVDVLEIFFSISLILVVFDFKK